MRYRYLFALACIWVALVEGATAQLAKNVAKTKLELKWIELDRRYKIQVPKKFILGRFSGNVTSFPSYNLNAETPNYTSIQIVLVPDVGMYATDPVTGRPRVQMDGTPLNQIFRIPGGMPVYYGWSVTDSAYECTMNSPCPVAVQPSVRYSTLYIFAAMDEAHKTIIEFRGIHFGAARNVKMLEGDGKMLRDLIVPSLVSIR